jgi:hypothetical protein
MEYEKECAIALGAYDTTHTNHERQGVRESQLTSETLRVSRRREADGGL